jgi:hypothetical protein
VSCALPVQTRPRRRPDAARVASGRPGRTVQVVAACCLVLTAAVSGGGCPGGAAAEPPAAWTEEPAAVAQATGDEIAAMLRLCRGSVSIGTLHAAVFPRGVSQPDTADPQWATLVESVRSVSADAAACDWVLTVVGYADATGTDEVNQRISAERAANAATLLAEAVGYPATLVVHSGVGSVGPGTSAEDRKVEISFTHA